MHVNVAVFREHEDGGPFPYVINTIRLKTRIDGKEFFSQYKWRPEIEMDAQEFLDIMKSLVMELKRQSGEYDEPISKA